jgi:hypothetical protein
VYQVLLIYKEGDLQMANLQSPVKAIRAHCIDCSGGSSNEVEKCVMTDCPLYPFRFGVNPFNSRTGKKKELTDEQRAEMRERFEKNVLKKES